MLYAHSKPDAPKDEWQTLQDHLNAVAELAAEFAAVFGGADAARLLGMVHDIGKGSHAFQRRLEGDSHHVDHSSAGAQLLHEHYKKVGDLLSYPIVGHHGGLPNGRENGKRTCLVERLAATTEAYDEALGFITLPSLQEFVSLTPPYIQSAKTRKRWSFSVSFFVRMLFSCLVDADYLDTERFIDEERYSARAYRGMNLHEMRNVLNAHVQRLESSAQGASEVNEARAGIRKTCIDAAAQDAGLFTLTVPTGGGKTLSALSFALEHAICNGQKRIIYVAPFTTIIDQTAAVLKGIFGDDSVLEHHSNYDFSDSESGDSAKELRERLSMENWDVPLIVTTNVQFFESLYSSKTSRSRKVHNIANSVVILDEAQTLPDNLLKPCLAALEELCDNYATSVVLCTATQPALEAEWPFESKPVDIVPTERRHAALFDERVRIEYIGEKTLDQLIEELIAHEQVLCVVSSRRAAGAVYDKIEEKVGSEGVYHLSALMVPEHRVQVLGRIRSDLGCGNRCVVVSTQLIEAGVDIDFPVVYREMAGIDSIKQSAGRCNREGCLDRGCVSVFECPEIAIGPKTWLSSMAHLGKEVIDQATDPFGDEGVKSFFEKRYTRAETDAAGIFSELSDSDRCTNMNLSFERYSDDFKLIDDDSVSVFIPWGETGMGIYENLCRDEADVTLARAIQKFSVSVYHYDFNRLVDAGRIVSCGSFKVLEPCVGELIGYSEEKGLVVEDTDVVLTI